MLEVDEFYDRDSWCLLAYLEVQYVSFCVAIWVVYQVSLPLSKFIWHYLTSYKVKKSRTFEIVVSNLRHLCGYRTFYWGQKGNVKIKLFLIIEKWHSFRNKLKREVCHKLGLNGKEYLFLDVHYTFIPCLMLELVVGKFFLLFYHVAARRCFSMEY